jgi:16S rRNA (guanine1207-N2)-methyltransferase
VAHYFDSEPRGPRDPATIKVTLSGRLVELATESGVFSKGRLDTGTAVLLGAVPAPPDGADLLDLGCGYGPIAIAMGIAAPGARVWAVDTNARARELCQRNAKQAGLTNVTVVAPDEMPGDVRFGGLWSNPPIRIGKDALHAVLHRWLARLLPGGSAYLVVQRHLGADSLAHWLGAQGWEVARTASRKGYRVLRVTAGAGQERDGSAR